MLQGNHVYLFSLLYDLDQQQQLPWTLVSVYKRQTWAVFAHFVHFLRARAHSPAFPFENKVSPFVCLHGGAAFRDERHGSHKTSLSTNNSNSTEHTWRGGEITKRQTMKSVRRSIHNERECVCDWWWWWVGFLHKSANSTKQCRSSCLQFHTAKDRRELIKMAVAASHTALCMCEREPHRHSRSAVFKCVTILSNNSNEEKNTRI